jgi:hypothetical protein
MFQVTLANIIHILRLGTLPPVPCPSTGKYTTVTLESMIGPVASSSLSLEAAGAALMRKQSLVAVGRHLVATSQELQLLSDALSALADQDSDPAQQAIMAQRCQYASEQMLQAGKTLLPKAVLQEMGLWSPPSATTVGKSWLKSASLPPPP